MQCHQIVTPKPGQRASFISAGQHLILPPFPARLVACDETTLRSGLHLEWSDGLGRLKSCLPYPR